MMRVAVICVGKLKERFYIDGAAEYLKRLRPYCKCTVLELPEQHLPDHPSPAEVEQALAKEGEAIRSRVPPGFQVVALCVEGRLRSSQEMANLLTTWAHSGSKGLAFVIGGSHGLHSSIKAQAWAQLSMSPMTFPHHLARVMLLEQIYRAFKIQEGSQYHK